MLEDFCLNPLNALLTKKEKRKKKGRNMSQLCQESVLELAAVIYFL